MKRPTIAVMTANVNSPYNADILNGIREAAKQMDVNVVCFVGVRTSYFYSDYFESEHVEDYEYQSNVIFDYSKLCDIDAFIVMYGSMSIFLTERELEEFRRKIVGYPTVYLEKQIDGPNIRHLTADSYAGIKSIMEHLIQFHGYKKILFLSGPEGNYDADERYRAYIDSMAEAGLTVTDEMIEYGDFSEKAENQINTLLDFNPDAEAIVCANDMMALTAYDVIAERAALYEKAKKEKDKDGMRRYKRHIIGDTSEFGIAITGFDNTSDAGNVEPPLTTLVQNPYSNGYVALKTVVSLLNNGDSVESVVAVPKPVIRQSCGCKAGGHLEFPSLDERYILYPEQYAATCAQIFADGILPVELSENISDEVYGLLYEIILKNVKKYIGIDGSLLNSDEMLEDTKVLISGAVSKYIPQMTFISAFNDFMMGMLKNAKEGRSKQILTDAEAKISEYVYSKLYAETREESALYRQRTWFMPLISRDMASNLDSLKDMYENAMKKLNVIDIGDVYIFVMEEKVVNRKNDKWECPRELRLVAYTENGQVVAHEPCAAPIVNRDNLINQYIKGDNSPYMAAVLDLYSGDDQYGIIVAKTTPDNFLSLYCASVQISTALKYCETAREQRRAQKELQEIIREVEDKNEILRSLSEYDQLTGCYNRRGFLEKGLQLIRENVGSRACMVFGDLDHLKEINDKYGHSEGDYAIANIANNLKQALPDSAILARLGGDEFVAIFRVSEHVDAEELILNIKNTSVTFNAFSAKPYYIECSVGYSVFDCEEDTSLEEVMALADDFLYEAKARRRKSIVKKVTVF